MRYGLHIAAEWLLGQFVRLAQALHALTIVRPAVLAWVDDVRKHKPSHAVVERCCMLLEQCPARSRVRAEILWRRALAFLAMGDAVNVRRCFEDLRDAHSIAETFRHNGSTAGHIAGALAVYHQSALADENGALRYYVDACHALRGHRQRAATLIAYGSLLRERGDHQTARVILAEARKVARDRRHRCRAHLELARLHEAHNCFDAAEAELRLALRLATTHRYPEEESDIRRQIERLTAERTHSRSDERAPYDYLAHHDVPSG